MKTHQLSVEVSLIDIDSWFAGSRGGISHEMMNATSSWSLMIASLPKSDKSKTTSVQF